MNILLASALPEVNRLFGVRHHHPAAIPAPGRGASSVRAAGTGPGEAMTFTILGPGSAVPGAGGGSAAHLTGTSGEILRISEELAGRGVPYLYSPMLPSVPSGFGMILDRSAALAGFRSASVVEAGLARRIAAGARLVLARNAAESRHLNRTAGIPLVKMRTVPGPAVPGEAFRGGAPGGGGREVSNLVVAFCDSITPEWNVMRLLFAMEKINADAVIVAGRSDSDYARACIARAELNPGVRFLFMESGNTGETAALAAGLAAKAAVVVDPSVRGLCGLIASGAIQAGVPSVVSARSLDAAAPGGGPRPHTFEPSSWELLHHAVTSALNRAAPDGTGGGGDGIGPARPARAIPAQETAQEPPERRNAETARRLEELYKELPGSKPGATVS